MSYTGIASLRLFSIKIYLIIMSTTIVLSQKKNAHLPRSRLNEISGEMGPILLDNATHHTERVTIRGRSLQPPKLISTHKQISKDPCNWMNNVWYQFLFFVHSRNTNVCLCLCMQHVFIHMDAHVSELLYNTINQMRPCASKRDSWIVTHSRDWKDD